jgi:tRNA A37 threonylcarbamoyladenosine dehydratase
MVSDWLDRTEMLLGRQGMLNLSSARILLVGLGGVGAYAAEMICRAGIGSMTIVDGDRIQSSNRNRQLLALRSTEGLYKTEVMASRLLDINPGWILR